MVAPPHAMVPGTTERDYYANTVTGASPEQAAAVVVETQEEASS
jgi:hypothetical protein